MLSTCKAKGGLPRSLKHLKMVMMTDQLEVEHVLELKVHCSGLGAWELFIMITFIPPVLKFLQLGYTSSSTNFKRRSMICMSPTKTQHWSPDDNFLTDPRTARLHDWTRACSHSSQHSSKSWSTAPKPAWVIPSKYQASFHPLSNLQEDWQTVSLCRQCLSCKNEKCWMRNGICRKGRTVWRHMFVDGSGQLFNNSGCLPWASHLPGRGDVSGLFLGGPF